MLQDYDHRAADVVTDKSNWVRQGQTEKRSLVSYQNPEQLAMPRFWVDAQKRAEPSHEQACIFWLSRTSRAQRTSER